MTAFTRVRRAQRRLALLGITGALAWGGTALLVGLALAAGVEGFLVLSPEVRTGIRVAAIVGAVAVLALFLWRVRFVRSPMLVALWIEERIPELRYALVTAVDRRYAELAPTFESAVGGVDPGPMVRRAARRSALPAVLALAVAGAAYAAVPSEWKARAAGGGSSEDDPAVDTRASRLEPLEGTLTPPDYAVKSGVEAQELDNPTTIAGLTGSRVRLVGPGTPEGIEVRLGDSALAVTADGDDQWTVEFTMPDSANGLHLTDRHYRGLVVLDPERDQAPTVQLLRPARDTTVRGTDGSMAFDIRIGDDLGLGNAWIEYIISSGEGEGNFTFRQGKIGRRSYRDSVTRADRIRLTVGLARFELVEGDRLSMRAVATDNNTYSGPDTGYSETRLLRVARRSEYDSLAIEGAPPALDSTMMSLRYLILLTEELEAGRPKLERKVFVDSSDGLGRRAERLRNRVQALQADQTMGGLFERNPLLDTAYLALAQGSSALRVAEPDDALPHLWEALRVLKEYAMAEKYYLRGKPPEVLVDLARIRLTGKDTGQATSRDPRARADTGQARLRALFGYAVRRLDEDPEGAVDRLLTIQVDALRTDPDLASALGEAIAAVRAERDPTAALTRARRILEGSAAVLDTLPRWSGAW